MTNYHESNKNTNAPFASRSASQTSQGLRKERPGQRKQYQQVRRNDDVRDRARQQHAATGRLRGGLQNFANGSYRRKREKRGPFRIGIELSPRFLSAFVTAFFSLLVCAFFFFLLPQWINTSEWDGRTFGYFGYNGGTFLNIGYGQRDKSGAWMDVYFSTLLVTEFLCKLFSHGILVLGMDGHFRRKIKRRDWIGLDWTGWQISSHHRIPSCKLGLRISTIDITYHNGFLESLCLLCVHLRFPIFFLSFFTFLPTQSVSVGNGFFIGRLCGLSTNNEVGFSFNKTTSARDGQAFLFCTHYGTIRYTTDMEERRKGREGKGGVTGSQSTKPSPKRRFSNVDQQECAFLAFIMRVSV